MMENAPNKCPICGKPAAKGFNPFCSSRCASVDLGKWLSESYQIESQDDSVQEEFPPNNQDTRID